MRTIYAQKYDPGHGFNWIQYFFIVILLSKIDIYKIKSHQNIKVIGKENQTKTNYIVQLIINQILSDKIKKQNKQENYKKKCNFNG